MKSMMIGDWTRVVAQRSALMWALPLTVAVAAACSAAPEDEGERGVTTANGDSQSATLPPEDGLADAFLSFVEPFTNNDFDGRFAIGFAFHPGLSTERVKGDGGGLMRGRATLNMNTGVLEATLDDVPSNAKFDLWFVKNMPGGTVAPETSDLALKVGRFFGEDSTRFLDASLGFDIAFDFDMLVVTRAGKRPTESRAVVGSRTLFEKRLFRFRQGLELDPVSGALANNVETTDPLVARGAQLFFNETFGGNGRTCGTCHRADNNLTIDPAFIAKLPANDPLFVAENNPNLAKLENPKLLRERALILENVDGFEDPTKKFVMRSVNHTLSLSLTNGVSAAVFVGPPDHRLGWGGDGGPGRSTLNEFTFGAIVQHFTKTLARKPGVDFRIPTQEELDALEAFQLFTGRQKSTDFSSFFPTDEKATRGNQLFFGTGCTFCHDDLFAGVFNFNSNFDTGVANLTPDLPDDDGFSSPGDRTFNPPPLVEAADTAPLFHNNSAANIEEAVNFYFSQTFQESPSGFFIDSSVTPEQRGELAAFLRVVNSFANLAQVQKRLEYVRTVRSPGNTELLAIALADTRDARVVLAQKNLNPEVRAQISKAETIIKNAQSDKDRDRPSAMRRALELLEKASAALFTNTPPDGGFPGGGGFGGEAGDFGGEVGGSFGGFGGAGGNPAVGGSFSSAGSDG